MAHFGPHNRNKYHALVLAAASATAVPNMAAPQSVPEKPATVAFSANAVTQDKKITPVSLGQDQQKGIIAGLNAMGEGQVASVSTTYVFGPQGKTTRLEAGFQSGKKMIIDMDTQRPGFEKYGINLFDKDGKPEWTAHNQFSNRAWGGSDFRGQSQTALSDSMVQKVSGSVATISNAMAGSFRPAQRASAGLSP